MELREVIGRRRSIRFVKTYKPVEPEKIQRMFEAARIASHWGNVQSLKAVAVFRDSASAEVLDAITATVVGWQVKIAPVVIVWYLDPEMVDQQSDRLRELLDIGALGFGDAETKRKGLEEQLIPLFSNLLEHLKMPGMGGIELLGWLREKIHARGSLLPAGELCREVTGAALSIEPYLDYLTTKFGEIYGFDPSA